MVSGLAAGASAALIVGLGATSASAHGYIGGEVRARAVTTDLTVDRTELRSAAWYTREELRAGVEDGSRTLPPRVSIARVLVEEWFGGPITGPRAVR